MAAPGHRAPDQLDQLLACHRPVLRYDSRERYFACSVALVWDPHPRVPGADRDQAPCLGFEGLTHGQARQSDAAFANRIYGHAATGSDGRIWLSYWFFYLYNDYTLIGPAVGAGRHEGDWEMIQLRLDAAGRDPDLALYAQHQRVSARRWEHVERVGEQPIIYVARGCHACYFGSGWHWTGRWLDRADGRGPAPEMAVEVIGEDEASCAWVHWPRRWGATRPGRGIGAWLGFDASSPHGPGHQRQWRDPAKLLDSVGGIS